MIEKYLTVDENAFKDKYVTDEQAPRLCDVECGYNYRSCSAIHRKEETLSTWMNLNHMAVFGHYQN